MAETHPQSLKRTLGGRYVIEDWIAHGGMSTVYKANDPNLRRPVAIKLIHPHLSQNSEFIQRFEQEAAVVAKLRHPNIVQVYDFNHEDGLYYMVLEYVEGETLQARLKALNAVNRRLPPVMTVQIMATVCDAVAYAHSQGMVHRDLKPANIMLDRQGQPILMDFGVAKMLGETRFTATGTVIGTALYMSPEQARGEHPDERTDIYSLGVTLFEMITGCPPFEGDSAVAIMMKHVNDPVPDIRKIDRSVPESLVSAVEKALAKDPADRYQDAADMAAALRTINLHPRPAAAPRDARPASGRMAAVPRDGRPASGRMAAVSASAAHTRAPAGRPWFTWLLSGAAAGILVLILVAAFLLVAWRFVRPLILAQSLNLPSADGTVRVPGGVYLVGLDRPGGQYARPQQTAVSTFWIDQYEVMNSQYADFLADTGQAPPDGWTGGRPPAGQERHPVHGVSWEQAAAYCGWAHKRLPTEAEWEVAARGPQNLLYPWGEDEHALELPRDATYSIGSVPSNRSPFGAYDMAGNVWEWVGEPYAEVEAGQRVLRGGGYGFLKDMAYRLVGDPHVPTMIATAGIRCAAEEVRGGGNEVEAAPNLAAKVEGVLFQDHFFDPASGWPSGEQAGGRFGYHPAAFYHVEVNAPNDTVSVFRGLSFGDFTAEAEVLVDHTNTQDGDFRYGLALRRSGDNYYAFTVAPRSRTWHALKHSAQGWQTLAEGEHDDIRGIGEVDKLRVDAAGPDFTFYINDRAVTEVSDSDYTGGDAGFVVETFDETLAHIHYASLTVREVDAEGTSVVSQDDFTDPSSGWPSQDGDGRFYGYHPPDYYHVEVNRANDSAAVFHGPELADVRVESAVFVDHTDTQDGDFRYGLALRRSGDNYYAFTVSPRSQTWHALKHSAEGWAVLSEGSVEGLTGLSQADMLRVDALGSDFTFRINDQIVAEVSDADYAAGGVGFIVETFDETLAHVHYDALEIRAVR